MNIIPVLMSGFVKSGRFARVGAFLPLLLTMNVRELTQGAHLILAYLVSGKAGKKQIALFIGTVLFLLSPITALPVIGILDDAVIVTLVFGYLHKKAMVAQHAPQTTA